MTISQAGFSPSDASGITFGTSAIFIGGDETTQGNWKGVYGTDGFSLAADGTSLPSYAQVAFNGQSSHTWMASTLDLRALQRR